MHPKFELELGSPLADQHQLACAVGALMNDGTMLATKLPTSAAVTSCLDNDIIINNARCVAESRKL
jgi:hypothetical protein